MTRDEKHMLYLILVAVFATGFMWGYLLGVNQ